MGKRMSEMKRTLAHGDLKQKDQEDHKIKVDLIRTTFSG